MSYCEPGFSDAFLCMIATQNLSGIATFSPVIDGHTHVTWIPCELKAVNQFQESKLSEIG